MSNVVQFLEALAVSAEPLSSEEFTRTVMNAGLDHEVEAALVQRDTLGLNRILGGRMNVMCLIVPAENDEPQEGEEKEGGESPSDQETSQAA